MNNNPYRYVDPDGRSPDLLYASDPRAYNNMVGDFIGADSYSKEGGQQIADYNSEVASMQLDALSVFGGIGIGAKAAKAALVPKSTIDQKKLGHIFRDRKGHLPDTPENRSLLEKTASDRKRQQGKDRHGNDWAAETREDGTQVWTQSRDGKIINGGVNDSARKFNSETGLSATEKPSKR